MRELVSPKNFLKLTAKITPFIAGFGFVLLLVGLYGGFVLAPQDYQQGDAARIMYVHVPAAWMAMGIYCTMGLASLVSIVWKLPLPELLAKSIAPVGAAFTCIALLTGAIWGKPMWGVWWVWDARLTSVLILFFIYMGYIVLADSFEDPQKGNTMASYLAILGLINIPIIKWSVDWWHTLHQPASVTKFSAPSIHASMLWPLLVMFGAYICYTFVLMVIRLKIELYRRQMRVLQLSGIRGG